MVYCGGRVLTEGPANPHKKFGIFFNHQFASKYRSALEALQQVQNFFGEWGVASVYQSQELIFLIKHIEVIVRQMTSKVRIDDGGDTTIATRDTSCGRLSKWMEAMSILGKGTIYTPMLCRYYQGIAR